LVLIFFCGIWYANSKKVVTEGISATSQNETSFNPGFDTATLVYVSESSGTVLNETYRFVMVKTPDGITQLINKKIVDKNAPPLYEVGQVLKLDKYSIVEAPGKFTYQLSE